MKRPVIIVLIVFMAAALLAIAFYLGYVYAHNANGRGYSAGFEAGKAFAQEEAESRNTEKYEEGYAAGLEQGRSEDWNAGYKLGYADGNEAGRTDALNEKRG